MRHNEPQPGMRFHLPPTISSLRCRFPGIPLPFPFPAPAFSSLTGAPVATPAMLSTPLMAGAGLSGQAGSSRANASSEGAREALKFIFSPQVGLWCWPATKPRHVSLAQT